MKHVVTTCLLVVCLLTVGVGAAWGFSLGQAGPLSFSILAVDATVTVDCPAAKTGEQTTATATAKGFPAGSEILYSWEYSRDGGNSWSIASVSEFPTYTLTVNGTTLGYDWRVVASSGDVSATSLFWVSLSQAGETFSVSYNNSKQGTSGSITYKVLTEATKESPGTVVLMDGKKYTATADSPALRIDQVVDSRRGYTYVVAGINRDAFAGNANLYDVVIASDLTSMSYRKDTNDYEVPCALGPHAFEECANLRSVSFECSTVVGIGAYSFSRCPLLTAVTFAEEMEIEEIGIKDMAFSFDVSLREIELPAITAAKRKGDAYSTYGSTEMPFTSGYAGYWHNDYYCVDTVGLDVEVFYGCSGLESITFRSGNQFGMFAYWKGSGCGLRFLPRLKSLIFEDVQPYIGSADGSIADGRVIKIWGDQYDSETEETLVGATPTFYYAVDYYYTSEDLAQDNAAGDGRLARVEFAHGTSTAAIQTSDVEALSDQTIDREKYASKTTDGVIPDPNEMARKAESEGVAGFENASSHSWVWMLSTRSQSRREGLADSTKAYLVRNDDLSAGRVAGNPTTKKQTEALYRVCNQNFFQGLVQNTQFDVELYSLGYSEYQFGLERTRGLDLGTSPWYSLDSGGLYTLIDQVVVYDGSGNVLDVTDESKFSYKYERYDKGTGSMVEVGLGEATENEPLLITVTPKEGSGYDPETYLQEWMLVYAHSGKVLERYSSNSNRTWLQALTDFSNSYTFNTASKGFNASSGYGVAVSSGDPLSALVGVSFAGLSQGPINVRSGESGYGFGLALAHEGAYYTTGLFALGYDDAKLLMFKAGSNDPASYTAAVYKAFDSKKSANNLSDYNFGKTAVLVNPTYLEDSAAAAASFAYAQAAPVFYTDYDGSLPRTVLSQLRNYDKVVLIGDEAMVSTAVEEELASQLGSEGETIRIQGKTWNGAGTSTVTPGNACALSLAMADYLVSLEGSSVSRKYVGIVVASGSDMVNDVVGVQNFSGHQKGITLVVSTSADAKTVADYLFQHRDEIGANVSTSDKGVIRLYGRNASAVTTSRFGFFKTIEKTWGSASPATAIDTTDTIEMYGAIFSKSSKNALTYKRRVWGTQAIPAGTYYGLNTDGSFATYTLKKAVPALEQGVSKPQAEEGLVYTGKDQTGVFSSSAYSVTGGSATNAGTHTATVTLNANYKWTDGTTDPLEVEWSIAPASLDDATVELDLDSMRYTGAAIVPTVKSVTLPNGSVMSADNYELSYYQGATSQGMPVDSIVEVGTYTVVLSGTNNCIGSAEATFTVTSVGVKKPTVVTGLVYNGTLQTGVAALEGCGYSVKRGEATQAGDYQATVLLEAGRAWDDGTTDDLHLSWSIAPAPLEGALVTLSAESTIWTGEDVKPTVDSVVLQSGLTIDEADYDVTYLEGLTDAGLEVTSIVDSGDYTVKVTGKNNCSGSVSLPFRVNDVATAKPVAVDNLVYNAKEQVGVQSTDRYQVTGGSAVDVGTHRATVSLKDGYCWDDGTKSPVIVYWEIAPASLDGAKVRLRSSMAGYTGKDLTPSVESVVTSSGLKLDEEDYEVAFYKNGVSEENRVTTMVNVGTYYVVVTGQGNFVDTAKASFEIVPVYVEKPVAKTNLIYNGAIQIGVAKSEGYSVVGGSAANAGPHTATVTLAPGYMWSDKSEDVLTIPWNIGCATLAGANLTLSATERTYTGDPLDFSVKSITLSGNLTVDLASCTVRYYRDEDGAEVAVTTDDLVDVGSYYLVVEGSGNYQGSVKASFEITPRKVEKPVAKEGLVYSGEIQTGVTETQDYQVSGGSGLNAGSHVATVTLNPGRCWSDGTTDPLTVEWGIASASLEGAKVALGQERCVYAGTPQKPVIASVTCGAGAKLQLLPSDYTVTYYQVVDADRVQVDEPTNAGAYVVVVSGRANYEGSVEVPYTISPLSLEGATVELEQESRDYTGAAQTPVIVSVTCAQGDAPAPTSQDYTIAYFGDAATYSKADSRRALAKSQAEAQTDANASSRLGSGDQTALQTQPESSAFDTPLAGNVQMDELVDAGTYTVVITGKGNFEGAAQVAYTIDVASLEDATVTLVSSESAFDGKSKTPQVASVALAKGGEALLGDYDISYQWDSQEVDEIIEVGTYDVVLTGKGNCSGQVKATYKVLSEGILPLPTPEADLVYNEEEQTGVVAVTGSVVTGGSATDAGTYTATVSLVRGYCWSDGTTEQKEVQWSIAPKSLADAAVDMTMPEGTTYDGGVQAPVVQEVTLGKKTLDTDCYDVVYYRGSVAEENRVNFMVDAGDYLVAVTGKGNYCDVAALPWTIAPISLDGARITLSSTQAIYNGSSQAPDVASVVAGGFKLDPDTDFTLDYYRGSVAEENKVLADQVITTGTYLVVVTGTGNFANTAQAAFEVKPIPVEKPGAATVYYNGQVQTGVPDGTGYTVTGGTAKAVGSHTAHVVLEPNYAWSDGSTDSLDISWEVQGAPLEGATLELTSTEGRYTGGAHYVGAKVKLGDEILSSADFDITYYWGAIHPDNLIEPGAMIGVGTYYVVATGRGNYQGSCSASYVIQPIVVAKPTPVEGLVYNGAQQTGVAAQEGYTVQHGFALDAGTYTAIATLKDGYGWDDGSLEPLEIEWTLSPASLEGGTLTTNPSGRVSYTGNNITVVTTVLLNGKKLENSDYTVSYYLGQAQEENKVARVKAAGTYTIQVTGRNNYAGTLEASLVVRCEIADDPVVITGLVYNGSNQKGVEAGVGFTVEGATESKAGTYTATAKLKEGYEWRSGGQEDKKLTWSIAALPLDKEAKVSLVADSADYTGKDIRPTIESVKVGEKTITRASYDVAYYKGSVSSANAVTSVVEPGTYYVVLTFKGNYSGSSTVTYTVKASSTPVNPTPDDSGDNSGSGSGSGGNSGSGSGQSGQTYDKGGNAEDEESLDDITADVQVGNGTSSSGTTSNGSAFSGVVFGDDDSSSADGSNKNATGDSASGDNATESGVKTVVVDGWTIYEAPGNDWSKMTPVAAVQQAVTSPLGLALVGVCVLAFAGAVVFSSRWRKETDDVIGGTPHEAA